MTTDIPRGSPRGDDPVTPALSRWLDGRSLPGEAEAIDSRLASDPAFSSEVARLKSALEALRSDRRTRPPEGLGDRVLAQVAHGGGEVLRFERAARRYAVAAAALLAIGVGGVAFTVGTPAEAARGMDAFAALEDGRLVRVQESEVVLFAPAAPQPDSPNPRSPNLDGR